MRSSLTAQHTCKGILELVSKAASRQNTLDGLWTIQFKCPIGKRYSKSSTAAPSNGELELWDFGLGLFGSDPWLRDVMRRFGSYAIDGATLRKDDVNACMAE